MTAPGPGDGAVRDDVSGLVPEAAVVAVTAGPNRGGRRSLDGAEGQPLDQLVLGGEAGDEHR